MAPARAPKAPPLKMDTPIVTCVGSTQHTIFLQVCMPPAGQPQVCGGGNTHGTGAPAGFSIQWGKHSDPNFQALTCGGCNEDLLWPPSNSGAICKGSFSGTPGCSIYNLAAGGCVIVEIGNLSDAECGVGLSNCGAGELDCGTEYVFRAFAHANRFRQRSLFTDNLCCSTEDCVAGCVLTQAYWKTHPCDWPSPFVPGPNDPVNPPVGQCALTGNPNQQCPCDAVNTISIGTLNYTQCDLLCTLDRSGGGQCARDPGPPAHRRRAERPERRERRGPGF